VSVQATEGLSRVRARIDQLENLLNGTTSSSTGEVLGGRESSSTFATALLQAVSGTPATPAQSSTARVDLGQDAVDLARTYTGVPYLWGGTDPSKGLDCSGLVQLVYGKLGISLPRVSQQQEHSGTAVASLGRARPGDLVFFGSPATHVGIYVGNGKMIDAPRAGATVGVHELWRTPSAIRRVVPEASGNGTPATAAASEAQAASAQGAALLAAFQAGSAYSASACSARASLLSSSLLSGSGCSGSTSAGPLAGTTSVSPSSAALWAALSAAAPSAAALTAPSVTALTTALSAGTTPARTAATTPTGTATRTGRTSTVPRSSGSATSLSGPYSGLFTAAGRKHGVDPALLSAVAKAESGYRADARSPAGALGLMQLMPSTARSLKVDPLSPAQAVDGAARLLSGYLKAHPGRVDLALASYNAGPGAVKRYGGVPPYPETRTYIQRVTRNWEALR